MSLIYVIESLSYYFCTMLIAVKILGFRVRKLYTPLLFAYIPLALVSIQINHFTVMVICSFVLPVINLILLKLSIKQIKTLSVIYTYLFLFIVCAIATSIAASFFNINRWIVEIVLHIIMVIICCLLCFTKISQRVKTITLWTPRYIKWLILVLMFFSMVVLALILEIQNNAMNESWLSLVHRFLVLLILFVCSMLPILVTNAVSNKYLKYLTQNYEEQIQAQTEHYSALAKSNLELRRFRHDFKNLRIGLSELVIDGHIEEALAMINGCNETFINATDSILRFDTGNGIVDALLADKQQIANSFNICLEFTGAVPSEGIYPTDLCVLFGNTLDNAIEACQKLPMDTNKTIRVECKYSSGFLFITISNPVVEEVLIRNNSLPTTKDDKTLHGFGLFSLDQIVKNHNGQLMLLCSNKTFKVHISICVDF